MYPSDFKAKMESSQQSSTAYVLAIYLPPDFINQ